MIAFRRILCPVDFSDGSRRALDHAVAIAQWYGGTITALHVVHPIPYTDPLMAEAVVFTPEDLDRIRGELEHFASDELGRTPIATAVVQGNVVATILDEARTLPADLLVLGTHGRSGFERLILGSVTERALRKAECPVLTVPPHTADAVPVGPVMFSRILCPVDFSPSSTKALQYATSLAQEAGAALTVMHVVEPLPVYEPVFAAGGEFPNYEQAAVEATRARLHALVPRDPRVHESIAIGKPYRAILQRAAEERADLIVIGAHGGAAGLLNFFGSTTNHIVREATCPVLSLRA